MSRRSEIQNLKAMAASHNLEFQSYNPTKHTILPRQGSDVDLLTRRIRRRWGDGVKNVNARESMLRLTKSQFIVLVDVQGAILGYYAAAPLSLKSITRLYKRFVRNMYIRAMRQKGLEIENDLNGKEMWKKLKIEWKVTSNLFDDEDDSYWQLLGLYRNGSSRHTNQKITRMLLAHYLLFSQKNERYIFIDRPKNGIIKPIAGWIGFKEFQMEFDLIENGETMLTVEPGSQAFIWSPTDEDGSDAQTKCTQPFERW